MSKFATVKAVVDGKEVVIENVVSIKQEMGNIESVYAICGSIYGLCPTCQQKHLRQKEGKSKVSCGKHFIYEQVQTSLGAITINTSITIDKIIEVKGGFNGVEWEVE